MEGADPDCDLYYRGLLDHRAGLDRGTFGVTFGPRTGIDVMRRGAATDLADQHI